MKHQMPLVTCLRNWTNDPLCGWWHPGDSSSIVGVRHLWARGPVYGSAPRVMGAPAKSSFDLFMERLHSCPVKSRAQTPSAYQDSSPCLRQLQNKPQPPNCSLLCCYSKRTLHLVTIHRIRQHSQAKLPYTSFILPLRFREGKQFSKVRFML